MKTLCLVASDAAIVSPLRRIAEELSEKNSICYWFLENSAARCSGLTYSNIISSLDKLTQRSSREWEELLQLFKPHLLIVGVSQTVHAARGLGLAANALAVPVTAYASVPDARARLSGVLVTRWLPEES